MMYRINVDGINMYEEVIFNEYTKENTFHARELIREKYKDHNLSFNDNINYDIWIFNRALEIYKESLLFNTLVTKTKNKYKNFRSILIKINIFDFHLKYIMNNIESETSYIPSNTSKEFIFNECADDSDDNINRLINELYYHIFNVTNEIINAYENGYIAFSINYAIGNYDYILKQGESILDMIQSKNIEKDWVQDVLDKKYYSKTEWR